MGGTMNADSLALGDQEQGERNGVKDARGKREGFSRAKALME